MKNNFNNVALSSTESQEIKGGCGAGCYLKYVNGKLVHVRSAKVTANLKKGAQTRQ